MALTADARASNRVSFRSITRCFVRGEILGGCELRVLEAALRQMFDVPAVVLCGSGSLAIELALRALGVGPGDDVVVPAFCCSAIVRPIVAAGASPVFADVGPELNLTSATTEAALTAKTRAILVPHLFGNPADMAAIGAVARARNVTVVDDAAQALGAAIDSRFAAAWGHAGVLSFGSEKVCSGLGGGALILPEHAVAARARHLHLQPPSRTATLRLLFSTLFRHHRRRRSLARPRAVSCRRRPDKLPRRYRNEAMANVTAAVARSLLQMLPKNLAARRARVQLYRKFLGGNERLQLFAHAEGSACLTQVVRVLPLRRHHDLAAGVIAAAQQSGYDVHGSYIPLHLLPAFDRYKRRRPAHTQRLWEDLIELPCGPEVEPDDIARIAGIVQKAISF
jgi:dTDP-4-amino-4,6-dideoxygalactose transaminase